MSIGRINFGQRVAAAGGLVLLISMTLLDWYGGVGGGSGNAFDHPGFAGGVADVLLVIACVVAVGGAALAATSRSLAVPVAMSAFTTLCGALAMLLVFGRMIFQPGPDEFIELKLWIFVGLFAAGAITWGGWVAMRDEGAGFDLAQGSEPGGGTSAS